jgi:hypothetical protein
MTTWSATSRLLALRLALFGAVAAGGCLPQLNDPDRGPLTSTFAVSDYFTPSGFMGDGALEGFLTLDAAGPNDPGCLQPRPAGARGNCYAFTYYADPNGGNFWAGVYWVFPANSWGSRPGYAINSTNFKQLSFYAAVDSPTPDTKGGGIFSFFNGIAGGINGDNFYGAAEHNDVIDAEGSYQIGSKIGPEMKQYHIDLTNQSPATELVGAFAWSVDFPNDSCTCSLAGHTAVDCKSATGTLTCPMPMKIYLDDIVWDTNPIPTADAGTP